jgi:hypothetical protein
MRVLIGLAAAWCLALSAAAQPRVERFYGYAYDLDDGRYLYTEVHHAELDGGRWLRGTIRYYAADGREIAHKTLDFSQDPYIPLYTQVQPDLGYQEGIARITAQSLELFKQTREHGRRSASVARTPGMAADSGFHSLIYDHLPELLEGRTLEFRFAVAGRLDAYRFRVRKIGTTRFEGSQAVQLKAEPDSLLRWLVAPLILTYDPQTRRLLEYRGVSNILNPATGEAYNARIDYYRTPPDDAPKNLPPLD